MRLERAEAAPGAVHHITARLREWDRREIFATRLDDHPDALAEAVLSTGPLAWVAGLEMPIATFGCAPMWSGVWSMWLMATDEFHRIGLSVTKLVVRSIIPTLFDGGAHRLEARSMEGHHDAQRWLEVIGAQREATLRGYGRDVQDFHVYTWPRS